MGPAPINLDELPLLVDPADTASSAIETKSRLGEGGMGKVDLAVQRSLHREVAVKSVNEGASDAAVRALMQEALFSGYLEHPNLVPVHQLGRDAEGLPLLAKRRDLDQSRQSAVFALRARWCLRVHVQPPDLPGTGNPGSDGDRVRRFGSGHRDDHDGLRARSTHPVDHMRGCDCDRWNGGRTPSCALHRRCHGERGVLDRGLDVAQGLSLRKGPLRPRMSLAHAFHSKTLVKDHSDPNAY